MPISNLKRLGITCPYYTGPHHDDQHYLPSPVDSDHIQNGINNDNKVEYPLNRPWLPEIIDLERQDYDSLSNFRVRPS